ncbi:glycosyltransferase, partial [Candidatus Saccharibacteria bacterium]|nr:glycosyltransferase [Candidatus Saccharibacteria bacterium]
MKVAIVHDWFVGGGAERVAYELHKMYPDAPIYTSYCSPQWRQRLSGTKVITSYMQHWPFSKLRKFLPPLRALWFSHLNLQGFDLVISTSGAEAKGINVKAPSVHVNYCHAPTHYYWSRYEEYMKNPGFGALDSIARLGLKLLVGPMRRWDKKAAQRPDHMVANSNYIKEQVKKYYGRDASVIHPPVDI